MSGQRITILHLDDDKQILIKTKHSLKQFTFDYELDYHQSSTVEEFHEKLSALSPQCIILDNALHGAEAAGIKVLKNLRKSHEDLAVLMLSSGSDPDTIKTALLSGASDYASKGLEPAELAYRINQAVKNSQILKRVDQANSRQFAGDTMRSIHIKMPRIIKSPVKSILVTGESGTGKEKIFEMIQSELPSSTPFVTLNCAAIANNLIESELFGHVKGAFTGAQGAKTGLFEQANGGWIFLDEVARLSYDAQSSLLRTLESGEIRPVGSNSAKQVNVRVLAATNENLDEMAEKGEFRQDLIQRLRSYEIVLPPLRERGQNEISEIIDFLVYRLNRQAQDLPYAESEEFRLTQDAKILLMGHDWKAGNIREIWQTLLGASVEALSIDGCSVITASSLPISFVEKIQSPTPSKPLSVKTNDSGTKANLSFPIDLKEEEDRLVLAILEQLAKAHPECLRFKSKILEQLSTGRTYLESKMDRLHKAGILPEAYQHFYK